MSEDQDAKLRKLERMLDEERRKVEDLLSTLDVCAKDVYQMAADILATSPAGSEAKANAGRICGHAFMVTYWVTAHTLRLKSLRSCDKDIDADRPACSVIEQAGVTLH